MILSILVVMGKIPKNICTKVRPVDLIKESNLTTLHCARILLLLSGVSFELIPNMGMNKHRVRHRKILSSTVEVMEISECE